MSPFTRRTGGEPYGVLKERLASGDTDLTGFFFHHGANVYALSYTQERTRRHTLIDAGDSRYRDTMLATLAENGIDPAGIERIILTHRHPDHCGLAHLLAGQSGAKIMVHASFRDFVEGAVGREERHWLGDLQPARLSDCDIEYLVPSARNGPVSISGVDFPSLAGPLALGRGGSIRILACPESGATHSPDQVIVLYSPGDDAGVPVTRQSGFRPADEIVFSGDLWLMRGPMYYAGMRDFSRQVKYGFRQVRTLLSGGGMLRRDPREQDAQAKEALKRGFSLVRVEPGHGEEFLGSRLLPSSLLADRDLLVELGYSMDEDTSLLRSAETAPRVAAIREQAYLKFAKEVLLWVYLGYTPEEVTGLLVRIYREQSGGGPLVEQDRRQRRERLRVALARMKDDEAVPGELHPLAASTLAALKGVS